jgi:hypothetical protein
MFSLTLRDHLRLTFTQVLHQHKVHTQAAEACARWNRILRGSEALLMGGVGVAAAGAAFGHGRIPAIVAATLACIALVVLLVHLTFDFDASAHAHAECSAHLWQLRERYRSLLSDLHDGVLDIAQVRARRDQLMDDFGGIYEKAPPVAWDEDSVDPSATVESMVTPTGAMGTGGELRA